LIRQAISCDICGSEKRQTNHWFVAYEQAGELRVGGWSSRHRLRSDSKHLCGQTCLHKLVDEFMAKSIASRARPVCDDDSSGSQCLAMNPQAASADGEEVESSARLVIQPAPAPCIARPRLSPLLVAIPQPVQPDDFSPISSDSPQFGSRSWHAEAWQRERERERRANETPPKTTARRQPDARRGA
jgi:hypothetical protein